MSSSTRYEGGEKAKADAEATGKVGEVHAGNTKKEASNEG
jgi:hypothetical protein